MDTQSIIAELESRLDAINQAIAALRGYKGSAKGASPSAGRPRRHLSAAARRRIGEAMKRRWAERKKKAA